MRVARVVWLIAAVSLGGCTTLLGDFTIGGEQDDGGSDAATNSDGSPHLDSGADARGDAGVDAGCGALTESCCGTTCHGPLVCVSGTCRSNDTGKPCTTPADCQNGICLPAGQPVDGDAGWTGSVCSSTCEVDGGTDAGTTDAGSADAGSDGGSVSSCIPGWSCVSINGIPNPACKCSYAPDVCDGIDNDCDGVVDDPATANDDCMKRNAAYFVCKAGACTCGTLTCGSACVDPQTDGANCGGCGNVCPRGATCIAAGCVCPAGQTDVCNNVCTNKQTSTVDCGACGNNCNAAILNATGIVCGANAACDYGACNLGFADFDGKRANGCESTLPTAVPEASNLVLWLAGENWNGQVWADSSGGGRHAYVTSGYGTPGTGTLNGRSTVSFQGQALVISAGFPGWAGLTVLAVSNTSADDALITMGVSYNPSCTTTPPLGAAGCVAYDMLAFGAGMGLQQCDPQVGSCYQAYSPGVPLNTWIRTTAWENPSANPSFYSYFNGANNGALNHNLGYPYPPPWSTPRKDTILGWRNYRGNVAELIVYSKGLSDASRIAIDTYLANKWNVH